MASISIRSLYQPQQLSEIVEDNYWESELISSILNKNMLTDTRPLLMEELIDKFMNAPTTSNIFTSDIINYIITTKCSTFLDSDITCLTYGLINPKMYISQTTGSIQKLRIMLDICILFQLMTENQAYLILSKLQSKSFNTQVACQIFREIISTLVDIAQWSLIQRANQLSSLINSNTNNNKKTIINNYDIHTLRYTGLIHKQKTIAQIYDPILNEQFELENFRQDTIFYVKPKILKVQTEFGIIQLIERRKISVWKGDINNKIVNFIKKLNDQQAKFNLNLYPIFLEHISNPIKEIFMSENQLIIITPKGKLIKINTKDFILDKLIIPHYQPITNQKYIINYLQQIHDNQLIDIELLNDDALIRLIIINTIPFQFNPIELSYFIRTRGQLPYIECISNNYLITRKDTDLSLQAQHNQIINSSQDQQLKKYITQMNEESNEWHNELKDFRLLNVGMTLPNFKAEDYQNRQDLINRINQTQQIQQQIILLDGLSKEELLKGKIYNDYLLHHQSNQPVLDIKILIGEYLTNQRKYEEKIKQDHKITQEKIEEAVKKQQEEQQQMEQEDEFEQIIQDEINQNNSFEIETPNIFNNNNNQINVLSPIQDILLAINNEGLQTLFNEQYNRLINESNIPQSIITNNNLNQSLHYYAYQLCMDDKLSFKETLNSLIEIIQQEITQIIITDCKPQELIYLQLENTISKYLNYNWLRRNPPPMKLTNQKIQFYMNLHNWKKSDIMKALILKQPIDMRNEENEHLILNIELIRKFFSFVDKLYYQKVNIRIKKPKIPYPKIYIEFTDQLNNTCLLRALVTPLLVNEHYKKIKEKLDQDQKTISLHWEPPPLESNPVYGNIEDILYFIGNKSILDSTGKKQIGIFGEQTLKMDSTQAAVIQVTQQFDLNLITMTQDTGTLVLKNDHNIHWEADYYFNNYIFTNTKKEHNWSTFVIIRLGKDITKLIDRGKTEFVIQPSAYINPVRTQNMNIDISFSSQNLYLTKSAYYWQSYDQPKA